MQAKEQQYMLRSQEVDLKSTIFPLRLLEGFVTICSYCNQIRDKGNHWHQSNQNISGYSKFQISHGICPKCFEEQIKLIGIT
jgi:hypothetical protein